MKHQAVKVLCVKSIHSGDRLITFEHQHLCYEYETSDKSNFRSVSLSSLVNEKNNKGT